MLRYPRRRPAHLAVLGLTLALNLVGSVGSGYRMLLPVLARDGWDTGRTGYGLLAAALAWGAAAVAVVVPVLARPLRHIGDAPEAGPPHGPRAQGAPV